MTVRDLFERAAETSPDAVFMRFWEGNAWRGITYAQTLSRVRSLYAALRPLKLEPGRDVAAVMLDNSPLWIELYLALSGAGTTVTTLDPKLRLSFLKRGFLAFFCDPLTVAQNRRRDHTLSVVNHALPRCAALGAVNQSVSFVDVLIFFRLVWRKQPADDLVDVVHKLSFSSLS